MPTSPRNGRRRPAGIAAVVVLGIALSLASAPAARAGTGPGTGHDQRHDGEPVADFGDENYGVTDSALADLTMADSCQDAGSTTGLCYDSTDDSLIPPEPGTGGTVSCAMVAHHDRTNVGPPTDATYVVNAYLVPADVTVRNFDRPTVCSSGTVSESNIGRSNYNTRKWMYLGRAAKSLETRKRTVSAYNRTFSVVDVALVRLPNSLAYYAADHWTRLEAEMKLKGWDRAYTKYSFYADARPTADVYGTTPAGQAGYGGKRAYAFRRILHKNVAKTARWGCGDEGDAAAIHEQLHLFSIVNPAAPDYGNNNGTSPYHAVQTSDVMHWQLKTTLSGWWGNGAAAPKSVFDPGADTYTTSIQGRTGYLLGSPGSRDLYLC